MHRTDKYSQHSSMSLKKVSLAKWLSARLRTKGLWVRIPLSMPIFENIPCSRASGNVSEPLHSESEGFQFEFQKCVSLGSGTQPS